jgi:SAM-dependent methyltransferase
MPDPAGGLEALRRLAEAGGTDPAAALAQLYDLDLEADDPADLDLYRSLASRTGGPILELAAGTGRITVPLAEAGFDVTAVDLDPAMLSRAADQARAVGVGDRVTLVEADLLDLGGQPLPDAGRYRLAILALNSIFLLADRTAQADALRALAVHLAPGGLAVVDVWLPSQADLAVYDGRLMLAALRLEPDGTSLTKTWSAVRDPDDRIVEVTTWYDLAPPGGAVVRWVRRDPMRLVGPDELRAMAEGAGLEVELVAGDRDLGPLDDDSERAVLVARRPDPA